MADTETDVLIIGTGPAGSMSAAHLSSMGISNIAVNRYRWLANTPRAHITNQRALECARDLEPAFSRDPELHAQLTTWPGSRLPHAWLYPRAGGKVSTLDLCGKGRFTLLTGPGGEAWATAAEQVGAELGLPIQTHIIGPRRPVEDPVGDWAWLSEVGDSGVVLVRPDHHVGWCMTSLPADAYADLSRALRQILALT